MTQTIVSPSLIVKNKPTKHYQEDFCLGIPGWCPCSDCASFSLDSIPCLQDQGSHSTSMETRKKGLKWKRTEDLKGKATDGSTDIIEDVFASDIDKIEMDAEKENICDRFSFDTTVDELEKLMEGECPANTAKNTEWAYNTWRTARNKRYPKMRCPEDVFSSKEVACEWLCKYVTETRKADGSEYIPRSLYLLLAGIQRYVRKLYPKIKFNLFSDHEFKSLKNICDSKVLELP